MQELLIDVCCIGLGEEVLVNKELAMPAFGHQTLVNKQMGVNVQNMPWHQLQQQYDIKQFEDANTNDDGNANQ